MINASNMKDRPKQIIKEKVNIEETTSKTKKRKTWNQEKNKYLLIFLEIYCTEESRVGYYKKQYSDNP